MYDKRLFRVFSLHLGVGEGADRVQGSQESNVQKKFIFYKQQIYNIYRQIQEMEKSGIIEQEKLDSLSQDLKKIDEELRKLGLTKEEIDKLSQELEEERNLLQELEEREQKRYEEFQKPGKEKAEKNKLTPEDLEEMKNIKGKEFLRKERKERLRYITIGNISYEDVENDKDSLEFSFTFDGSFNSDLYFNITTGQVLPPNVRILKSEGESWERKGVYGEFYNKNGKRLVIREGTKIKVKERREQEEVDNMLESYLQQAEQYKDTPNYDMALFSLQRGLDPNITTKVFSSLSRNSVGEKEKFVEIESLITQFEQKRNIFKEYFPQEKVEKDGNIGKAFLMFFLSLFEKDKDKRESILKSLNFSEDDIKNNEKFTKESFSKSKKFVMQEVNPEDLKRENITPHFIEQISSKSIGQWYPPGEVKTQKLFSYAAMKAGMPTEWGSNSALHDLLKKESGGGVGRPNFTLSKRKVGASYFEKMVTGELSHFSSKQIANYFGVSSTASGLGQMLVSNADIYYPNGRNGIGIPLDEAIGMLRYIKQRYGDPESALAFHNSHNRY